MMSNELDFQSLLPDLEPLSYVILKHILSEDDCLQFSYSSVYPNNVTVHGSRLPPEVPDNQSSISSRINQNEPNRPQTPSRYSSLFNFFWALYLSFSFSFFFCAHINVNALRYNLSLLPVRTINNLIQNFYVEESLQFVFKESNCQEYK